MDPVDLGLLEVRAALDRGELSCRELLDATLARIDAVNPELNAIVARADPAALRDEAGRRDRERAAVRRETRAGTMEDLGLLHGVPQATKDTTPSRGMVTTWGSPIHAGHVPEVDATVVARMRAAGAIFVGKTNVPEFGYGSHSYNAVYGVTRNVFDRALSAGGSSGGAAVAVASGMLCVADGSDVMGSLRNPAAFNRVLGLRPTSGRVPNHPAAEGFIHDLGTCGPIARSVADLAALLAVQTGHEPRDPRSLRGDGSGFAALAHALFDDDGGRPQRWLRASVGARRTAAAPVIGWLGDLGGHLAMEAGIIDHCEAALRVFEAEGCAIEPVTIDFSPDAIWQCWLTARSFLIAGVQAELHADPAKRALMKPEARWEIERGLGLSAIDAHRGSVTRTAFLQRWLDLFERVDFLALPTAQVRPFPVETTWPAEIAGRKMDTYHRWMEVVLYPTLTGSPAISLPVPGGELIGVQLIGPPGEDERLLGAAAAYQLATVGRRGWSGQHAQRVMARDKVGCGR
ncbi:MAG: amidase [Burkholderiaceae bacterium]